MGRPRKPLELVVLEGNRGHRPLPSAPQFPPLVDACPRGMPRDGRRMWIRVCSALERSTILQASDYGALVALCETWAVYRAAIADVNGRGPVVNGARSGDLVKNPAWTVAAQALAAWTGLAARFGLTPVDRGKIVAEHLEAEADPLQELLAEAEAEKQARQRRKG